VALSATGAARCRIRATSAVEGGFPPAAGRCYLVPPFRLRGKPAPPSAVWSPMSLRPLALLLVLAASSAAQPYFYALNTSGKLTVNGTVLDKLPTDFDPETGQFFTQVWFGLDVEGSDRHALRYDGRLHTNGKKAAEFLMGLDGTTIYGWRTLDATPNAVHLLREDGLLVTGDVSVVTYPRGGFKFTKLVVQSVSDVDTVFALRWDGSIFSGTSTSPVAKLTASELGEPNDGADETTLWSELALDLVNGKLLALRQDGELWSVDLVDIIPSPSPGAGDGEIPGGIEVAELPFPAQPSVVDLYVDLAFGGDTWRALNLKGEVYTSASVLEPLADYAGGGLAGESFTSVIADGDDTYALRGDGAMFTNTTENDPLVNLTGDGYVKLVLGTLPPDLTSFKNPQPKASPYTVTLREGQAASVPVLVSDVEKLSSDLVVTVNPDAPLPPGVMFVEKDDGNGGLLRTLEWDGSGLPGTYPCKLIVDDGVTTPRKFTTNIKVKPLDVDPLKNKPPSPAGIKQVMALVGYEVSIPILADDLDGDAVEVTVNEDKYPFTAGAAFDTVTDTFTWTPNLDDLGVKSVKFSFSDGLKTKTRTYKVKVISPLIFEAPPPPSAP
jgi:hypothetical protein